jgi:hypothetical protein
MAGMTKQIKDIRPEERFAPGKKDDRNAEGGQIVDDFSGLGRGQFVIGRELIGVAVAVGTGQITSPGDIPNDNGSAESRGRKRGLPAAEVFALSVAVTGGTGRPPAIQKTDIDHIKLSAVSY